MPSVIFALILFWNCNGTLDSCQLKRIMRLLWLWEELRNIKRQEKNFQIEGSIPGGFLGNFQVTYSFCSYSATMGSTEHLKEMTIKNVYLG
jgi:hypothetical protein